MAEKNIFLEPCGRRHFLAGLCAVAGAAAFTNSLFSSLNPSAGTNAAGIPQRVLGRTRQRITIIGLGTAPVGHSMPGSAVGVPVYRAALEAGINYVDTARGYDDAESYLGELVPAYRDRIFLVTKAGPHGDTPADAVRNLQKQFDQSLRLMKTDHVDLLHLHNVGNVRPGLVLAPGGPLEWARKMKEKGLTRFIGITGHSHVSRFAEIINTGEIDVVMVVLNFVDAHTYKFESEVLPAARRHGCGIVAMKVFGGHRGNFAGYRKRGPAKMSSEWLEQSLRYSLGIKGVAGAVLGAYTSEEIQQQLTWVKRYQPLSAEERSSLLTKGRELAAKWGPRFGPPV